MAFVLICLSPFSAQADPMYQALNAKVQATLEALYARYPDSREMVQQASGVLVFPDIAKGGFFIGAEFGEGALLRDMTIIDYYQATGASLGIQFGVQVRSHVVLFNDESSYKNFRSGNGWEVGVDGSVAIATEGAGGRLDSKSINQPVTAFILSNKGLMLGASLEGTRFARINKP